MNLFNVSDSQLKLFVTNHDSFQSDISRKNHSETKSGDELVTHLMPNMLRDTYARLTAVSFIAKPGIPFGIDIESS